MQTPILSYGQGIEIVDMEPALLTVISQHAAFGDVIITPFGLAIFRNFAVRCAAIHGPDCTTILPAICTALRRLTTAKT